MNLKKLFLNQTTYLLLSFSLLISPVSADSERGLQRLSTNTQPQLALVIGNANYADNPLVNPINDAHDIAQVLKEKGFSVMLETDLNQRSMEEVLSQFAQRLRSQQGVGLFYFAGHGIQVKGENFLVPVDAQIQDETDVRYKAVHAGQILDKMEAAENPLNIVILDACRNNPFKWMHSRGGRQQGLAFMGARGAIVAYATAPGTTAADGKGRNGLFTKHLLDSIRTQGLSIEQAFKQTGIAVEQESNAQQSPWYHSALRGEFCFGGCQPQGNTLASTQTHSTQRKQTPDLRDLKQNLPSPSSADVQGDYPEASMRYLTAADLNDKSAWQLKVMRNEIFARYGYQFKSRSMQDHFSPQPWYQPKFDDSAYLYKEMLTPIEKDNIKLIQTHEKNFK